MDSYHTMGHGPWRLSCHDGRNAASPEAQRDNKAQQRATLPHRCAISIARPITGGIKTTRICRSRDPS